MADQTPDLAKTMPWYRGLTRYQWWVLLVASMGWMFDTMDQQFFNIGRGKAMMDVLDVYPVDWGMPDLGKNPPVNYTSTEVEGLVEKGVLLPAERDKLLKLPEGGTRKSVTRIALAWTIGERRLTPKYEQMGTVILKEKGETGDNFLAADIQGLIDREVLNRESADKLLETNPEGVSRAKLAAFLGKEKASASSADAGDHSTSIFVFGWAIGGLIFGWIGDAIGRAKTMAITILLYSIFTGLNGLAQTETQFNVLRFLTALGVGGEFAAGAALVAETMPDRSRAPALGALQALSAIGNMAGAALGYFIMPVLGWRWLFAVGALPGIVAVFVLLGLKEPEKWKEARARWLRERAEGITQKRASYIGLLGESRWRKRAIVGLLLGVVGVGALWGVGFFTPELNRMIAKNYSEERKEKFVAVAFFLQQAGAFFGISAYTWIALRLGRKPGFAIFFVLAFFVMSYTFLFANTITEAYVLAPVIGFVTLGPFGGYAIYFPELFPTRLRATGVGFCYNVGRFLAAAIPSIKSGLRGLFFSGALTIPFLMPATNDATLAVRYGSFVMIFIYIFGLFVLFFAPETKGQPLPED